MIEIDLVKPFRKNPRVISDKAVDVVAKSIQRFGFQQPIVVDEKNVIIAGHVRYRAARLLGMKEIPVIIASQLSSEQASAYRLADNKTNEFAEWNHNLLDEILAGIDDLDLVEGFDFEFLNQINTEEVGQSEQPRIDKISLIECPHCGNRFESKR